MKFKSDIIKVIGITGYTNAGKNTVTELLEKELDKKGIKYKVFDMSSPVHELVCKTLNISKETLNVYKRLDVYVEIENEKVLLRQYMNRLAETVKDIFGKDIYINKIISEMLKDKDKYDCFILTSIRKNIEYERLIDNGYLYLCSVHSDMMADNDADLEVSILDNYANAIIINNENDLDYTEEQVKKISENIRMFL